MDNTDRGHLRKCLNSDVLIDIFSFLERSVLVKNFEPVNSYFLNISKQVKNVHIIKKVNEFIYELVNRDEETEKTTFSTRKKTIFTFNSSNGSLAKHFRLTSWHIRANYGERYRRYVMSMMRHSLELFQNCDIYICPRNNNIINQRHQFKITILVSFEKVSISFDNF
ncbi:unnamed protein product [Meloidogyne enterolobii]|uniref:Uncharacterized protein n=1 Tax=Meloidogyne enterolobii TaxID=390850 RepID=A0ACB1A7S6_MELEN